MPRKSIPSNTLVAQVRHYFGLQQQELAAYLGVSPELVKHIEAGRRTLSSTVLRRLNPLALLLPGSAPAPHPEALPPGLPAPAAGPLDARRDYCLYKAGQLRRELRTLSQEAGRAGCWQQVLPGLLAGLSTPAEATEAACTERQRSWLLRRADTFSPADVARHHLLRLQAEALETEAAALAGLLGAALNEE